MSTDCDCDIEGPAETPSIQNVRALHRAAHDLRREAVEPWAVPVVQWLNRLLTRSPRA